MRILFTFALCVLLVGCGNVQKELGLERQPIDEFNVVTRAPLSLPPNYELRPPEPGAPRPQEVDTRSQLEREFLGTNEQDMELTEGERSFLSRADALDASNDVREELDRERLNPSEEEKGFLEKYNPFRRSKDDADTVDPTKEADRLRKEQEKRTQGQEEIF